jgi:hypothetical protein
MDFFIDTKYRSPKLDCWYVEFIKGNPPDAYIGKDEPRKYFDEWFSEEEAMSVEGIVLFSGETVEKHDPIIYRRFKDMSIFRNLKYLNIPLDAIEHFDFSSIKSGLRHLRIDAPTLNEYYRFYAERKHPMTYEYWFPNLKLEEKLPNLKTLSLYTSSPNLFRSFDAKNYPSLEWLDCAMDFDKSGKFFKLFKDSTTMQGYSLDVVSKKDLLKNVPKNIKALRMWSITTRQFDYSLFSEFHELKYLHIAGSFTPVDCSVFLQIPTLTELYLDVVHRIDNVSALLESPNLARLRICTCPKIDMTDDLKRRMSKKFSGFEYG